MADQESLDNYLRDNYINYILSQGTEDRMYGEYLSSLGKNELAKSLEQLQFPTSKKEFLELVANEFANYNEFIGERINRKMLDEVDIAFQHFQLFSGSAEDYCDELAKLHTDIQETFN